MTPIALPILICSLEALPLNKTEIISLEHPLTRCFEKVFNTFDKFVVNNCQAYLGLLPIKYCYCKQSMTFLCKLANSSNSILRMLYDNVSQEDRLRLAVLCDVNANVLGENICGTVKRAFMAEAGI